MEASESEISVSNRILIIDLLKNGIVRDEVFDGGAHRIVGIKVTVEFVELEGFCGGLVE